MPPTVAKLAARLLSSAVAPLWRALPPLAQLGLAALWVPPHMVSVVAVICDDRSRVLLVEHRLRRPALAAPGGFVAPGEQPEEALRREVREEVGLELGAVTCAFAQSLLDTPQIEIVFLCSATGSPAIDPTEVLSARWCPLDALPPDLHEDERERIFRALGRPADVAPAKVAEARTA